MNEVTVKRERISISTYGVGEPEKALDLVQSHRFHPWEGGDIDSCKKQQAKHLLMLAKQGLV